MRLFRTRLAEDYSPESSQSDFYMPLIRFRGFKLPETTLGSYFHSSPGLSRYLLVITLQSLQPGERDRFESHASSHSSEQNQTAGILARIDSFCSYGWWTCWTQFCFVVTH